MEATRESSGHFAVRGVLTTLFGLAAVFWPGMTLLTLVYLFSAFIMVSGVLDLVLGVGNLFDDARSWAGKFFTVIMGLIELSVGVYLVRHPGVSFSTLILLIGFTLVVKGVIELVKALFDDDPDMSRWVMVMIGLVTLLAGIVVLFQPVSAGVAFVWIIGLQALITGPLLIALGVQANKQVKASKR